MAQSLIVILTQGSKTVLSPQSTKKLSGVIKLDCPRNIKQSTPLYRTEKLGGRECSCEECGYINVEN